MKQSTHHFLHSFDYITVLNIGEEFKQNILDKQTLEYGWKQNNWNEF